MFKKLIVLLFFLTLVFSQGFAKEVPYLSGRVNDYGNILSEQTERAIDQFLKTHEDSTSNQVVVLTITSLEDEYLEGYSHKVAETWGIGQEEKDNGVLLLVSVQDRQMRIEVGYGLEPYLTDVQSARIIRNEIAPRFRQGDYDGGITAGVNAIVGAINGTYQPSAGDGQTGEAPPMIIGIFIMIFLSMFARANLYSSGAQSWGNFFFMMPFFFLLPMAFFGNTIGPIVFGAYVVLFIAFKIFFSTPAGKKHLEEYRKRQRNIIIIGGGGYGGSGGFGGGGGGFGGFSGGGGSFGGGGASGSW